jgi:hypothetical protein
MYRIVPFLFPLALLACKNGSVNSSQTKSSVVVDSVERSQMLAHALVREPLSGEEMRRRIALTGNQLIGPVDELQKILGPEQFEKVQRFNASSGSSLPSEKRVRCTYVDPAGPKPEEAKVGGMSPKFPCRFLEGKKPQKVKYHEENPEVFNEVIVSRIFWAFGFGSDFYFPMEVNCRNCPPEPWSYHKAAMSQQGSAPAQGVAGPVGNDKEVHIRPALLEIKSGDSIVSSDPELNYESGWGFNELLGHASPENRPEREALVLMASIFMHVDNKAANQRLQCSAATVRSGTGEKVKVCNGKVWAIVQDMGADMGGFDIFYSQPAIKGSILANFGNSLARGFTAAKDPIGISGSQCFASVLAKSSKATLSDTTPARISREGLTYFKKMVNDAGGLSAVRIAARNALTVSGKSVWTKSNVSQDEAIARRFEKVMNFDERKCEEVNSIFASMDR